MADNTQIVDHILKQEGQGTYSVYFKDLTDTDKQSIQAWLKDNLQYNDVQGAPELPSDNKAYDENNNIKPFDKLAFTADYDDLNNAPTIPDIGGERPTAFNPIAFTGVVNLDNVAVSNVINLNEYSINSNDTEHVAGMTTSDISDNNTKLQNIGSSDNFIKGLNAFQKNGNGILLFNTLQSKIISGGFLITKTPTYLVSNSGIYFLTDVKNTTWDGPTLQYFELHLVAVTDSNYTTIRTYEANITDETAEEILENIELTAKNVILIFDFSNNILYCKTKEIGGEQEQGIVEETDPIFTTSPAANINNQDIINWNNKIDQNKILNILDLKQYSATVGSLTVDENTDNNSKLQNIGMNSSYILGLNSFINNQTNETLVNDFANFISEYFNQRKSSYIISNYRTLLVTNISIINNEETQQPAAYQIQLNNSSFLNYSSIREVQSDITKEQASNTLNNIDTSANNINNLIIDLENNIIYFKQINSIIRYNQFFNLANYTVSQNQAENDKILSLGTENTYILNADQILIYDQYSLIDALQEFIQVYLRTRRTSYLICNNKLLLQIVNVLINTNYSYIQIDLKLPNITNYSSIKTNNIDDTKAQTTLTDLNIQNNQSSIILDLEQKVIYCKIKEEQS